MANKIWGCNLDLQNWVPTPNPNGFLLEGEHRIEQIPSGKFFLLNYLSKYTLTVSFLQVIKRLSRWKNLSLKHFIDTKKFLLSIYVLTWFKDWFNLFLLTAFISLFLDSSSVFFCPVHEFSIWFWLHMCVMYRNVWQPLKRQRLMVRRHFVPKALPFFITILWKSVKNL